MSLSVVDIYKNILPKTNCKDCGYSTCLAFASMVVSEQLPLKKCPHIEPSKLEHAQEELQQQYAAGKWTKRDMAEDALKWSKERAASMEIADLQKRIGGTIVENDGQKALELPYFNETILIEPGKLRKTSGNELTRWEQVFIFNHLAQGGDSLPTGQWKGLVELPNTVSKVKSMKKHVEAPLIERFAGKAAELLKAGEAAGAKVVNDGGIEANVAMLFNPLPRVPVMLLFWDEEQGEDYGAEVKLLFDKTVVDHLDIESIMFLSERIKQLLCGEYQ